MMGTMAHTIRRHAESSNYFILTYAFAQDERLSIAARGALLDVLSRPPDWRIELEVMRAMFKIGRDKLQGIMAEWRRVGYARLDLIRGENGQITGSEYVISSRPEFADEDRKPENPVPGAGNLKNRPPEKPEAGKAGSKEKIENIKKIDSPLNPPAPSADVPPSDAPEEASFEEFERAFGFDATTPLEPARRTFAGLSASDRRAAIRAAPVYAAECRRRNQTRAKPHTWLRQRGWEPIEKFSAQAANKAECNQVWLPKGSAEFEAWDQHLRKTTGKRLPSEFFPSHKAEGWFKPTKFPPMHLPPATTRFVDRTHHG
jgi:hypothetical protein